MNLNIKVGIKTQGNPVMRECDGEILLENMLIGDGFHWQSTISALLPGTVTPYRAGDSESATASDSHISLINELPLETYLECVTGSEMNPDAPIEFLKAHTVISRSWALGKILDIHPKGNQGQVNTSDTLIGWDDTAGHHGFHVCSDDHCQRYQGRQEIPANTLKAIRDTKGEILAAPDGTLVDARFSKCCGGTTEVFSTCWQPVKMPCIESFPDPWCDLSSLSTGSRRALLSTILKDYDRVTEGYGYRWSAEITKSEIASNLARHFGRDIGEILNIRPLHRGASGRIDLLRITGTRGSLDLGKELWIRRILSSSHLYSSAFEVEDKSASLRLTGKGWGHGAGLCQIGAANMAAQGHSYREILSFYYPGSKLTGIDSLNTPEFIP